MVWQFVSPTVAAGDQNIDSVCIRGTGYSGGGFCCGIKYVNEFSSQPEKWAIWASDDDFSDHTTSNGFENAVDDSDNWRTDDTSFTVTWEINRWLPKEERSIDYYVNEYRFVAGDTVTPYTYKYTATDLFSLDAQSTVTLAGGLSGVSYVADTLIACVSLFAF